MYRVSLCHSCWWTSMTFMQYCVCAYACSHLPVKGVYMWCQGCAHGGHLQHIISWFDQHQLCPAGCGHCCEFAWRVTRIFLGKDVDCCVSLPTRYTAEPKVSPPGCATRRLRPATPISSVDKASKNWLPWRCSLRDQIRSSATADGPRDEMCCQNFANCYTTVYEQVVQQIQNISEQWS